MRLLLDVGNTRIKWATLEGRALRNGAEFAHRGVGLTALLDAEWAGLTRPSAVVVSSVAGRARDGELRQWIADRWGVPVHFAVSRARQSGVRNGYRDPARLGVDRWIALLAARARFDGPVCVVDCGSALTVDGLTRAGDHLGGLIVPGLWTMHRCLTAGDIALDAGEMPPCPAELTLGRDTNEAVGYGIQQCLALYVDGVCERVAASLGEEPVRVVTGGDAARLLPLLGGGYRHAPHLVLEGVALIAGDIREDSA